MSAVSKEKNKCALETDCDRKDNWKRTVFPTVTSVVQSVVVKHN